tara:strand:- start:1657 stop:1872 length:216 start_codon:yes stop_codon:yes gene_type:complete
MYWSVLILTYYVEEHTIHSEIFFKDMATCHIASDIYYPLISEEYEFSMSRCRETDLIRSEFGERPKIRPKT